MVTANLEYKLRKDSVDNYIDDLLVEMNKLKEYYSRDTGLSSKNKAETLEELMTYVTTTKYHRDVPPKEEPIDPRA